MKLSCLPVSYFKQIISGEMPIEKWAKEANEIGFDAIDISILFLKNRNIEYLKRIREEIEKADMHIAILNTYPDFTHPDPNERLKQIKKLQSDIKAAVVLGAELIRVTAGQAYPQTSIRDGIIWAVEGLKISADFAEYYDVKLVYENHSKPGIWKYSDFSLSTNIFMEIVERLKGTKIGILFDTANPLVYGDNPLSFLMQVIERVVCLHAADIKTKNKLEPTVIGTGIVPFADIFSILREKGFNGWISIEEASGKGWLGIKEAHDFIRRVWEESA